jgi:hypothetical protein
MNQNREIPPIFIVGVPRSGTTLLRFILSSHPRIYIPDETGFLPFINIDPDKTLNKSGVASLIKRIGILNKSWEGIIVDINEFYDELPEKKLYYVLTGMYKVIISPYHAIRWGDKTPGYINYIPHISTIFPNAQFIHIIRDGRDVTLSSINKWGHKVYMDSVYLLNNWVKGVEEGRSSGSELGRDRYLEIFYEELIINTIPTINKISEFLNEGTHPNMYDHTKLSKQIISPSGHVEVRASITDSSVNRWKSEMSTFDKKISFRIASKTLQEFHYETPNHGQFTLNENIKFNFIRLRYKFFRSVRKVLYRLGFITLNWKKRKN